MLVKRIHLIMVSVEGKYKYFELGYIIEYETELAYQITASTSTRPFPLNN